MVRDMNLDGEALGAALANLKRSWSKGTCLHPDAPTSCNGKPIQSHTLQRSRALEAISFESHVLKLAINPVTLFKSGIQPESPEDLQSAIVRATELKRLGLRDASVFPGFCGKHDNDTFAPIEEGVLMFDELQCFLATYRPACLELWAKRSQILTMERAKKDGADSEFADELEEIYIQNEANHLECKAALDLMLMSRDFSELHWLVFKLDANPGVATAGMFAPEVDFADSLIQNIHDTEVPLHLLSFSILPDDSEGHAVIGWQGESPAIERFVESLLKLDPSEWPDALLRVAFESIENTYFAAAWWDGLTESQQQWAISRAGCGAMSPDPPSYKPDGIGIAKFAASVLTRR